MYLSLAHVCIHTKDLEQTFNFYNSALGMKRTFEYKNGDDVCGYFLRMSEGNFIEVRKDDNVAYNKQSPNRHMCFECRDLDACYQKLNSAGLEPTEIQLGQDQTYRFWVTDPNGIELEFLQYTTGSCQLTGATCCADW